MIFNAEDLVGRYSIIGLLGQGGMGEVFLAEDKNLNRDVSLKVLQGSLSSDEHFKSQFRQEARSISSIVHPNIVQIHNME
jgi:eukaryotic-like serine/threonine-protein kinase